MTYNDSDVTIQAASEGRQYVADDKCTYEELLPLSVLPMLHDNEWWLSLFLPHLEKLIKIPKLANQ
jgi:hypothetical protein